MPVQNGSGHDVEYEVKEGEAPPLVEVPPNAMFASMAFTFAGTGFLMLGCLPQLASPFLTATGAVAIGIALGIQGFALAGRRQRASRQLRLTSGGGTKSGLRPGQTVPYIFGFGDRVVFCWVDDEGPKSVSSAAVVQPGALVQLVEYGDDLRGPSGSTHGVVIHD